VQKSVRTWIEIDKEALEHNLKELLKLIPRRTRFMAVIKSNAYGHGLVQVAKQLTKFRIRNLESANRKLNSKFQSLNSRLWFGVDSIVEALRLREEGIDNPILVLGSTLPNRIREAAERDIIITVSNFESLRALIGAKERPIFHIKIDTGMHRQGFFPYEVPRLIKLLKRFGLSPQGVFTHFAAAKDIAYPTYTLEQFGKFQDVVSKFKRAGFKNLIRHAAASGGTLLFPQTHLDMVRVGMSLYGYFPSPEAKIQFDRKISLRPVLSWKTMVSEIKEIPSGSYVGYDLTERVSRHTKMAVLPVGYWHGYDRGLSSIGQVLVGGKRRRVLGRISMDMMSVDITDIPGSLKLQISSSKIKAGDEVVLIGKQGKDIIFADELALKIGTSQYEFLTRINPLIERIIV